MLYKLLFLKPTILKNHSFAQTLGELGRLALHNPIQAVSNKRPPGVCRRGKPAQMTSPSRPIQSIVMPIAWMLEA
ncbi:hypothetical protein CBM2633_P170003 [Cupriavidus taiwanensis]|uniref:Uncharacterized protein n=2 Tax=Cupriavidus TaxID=106589 RepID=A0A375HTX0_9BURK|nr:hypothetical protein CBM2588_P190003 [Cupriavidus taiwanensis]SOZ40451.1 hypothetical protein CBM2605_P170003 [Cupriavidus neocaledonicus]SOY74577.1 hypothetical protein CBM2585_P170003 [Cupriavidus taiwanensis]SOY74584.1 hypothetical protein CBM2592_P200003 [Cupriavidus taiwanensis]SOY75518.1 hypothetical protein CBM2589_P170003 [Cupriavidus taiwanensis]